MLCSKSIKLSLIGTVANNRQAIAPILPMKLLENLEQKTKVLPRLQAAAENQGLCSMLRRDVDVERGKVQA